MFSFSGYVENLIIYANAGELPAYMYDKSPEDFFYLVSQIPYKEQGFESVSRKPLDIIRYGGDCGEKTKLCMMYFLQRNMPFDLVFLKSRENLYHVFPRAYINGDYVDFDTAYGCLRLGQRFALDEAYRVKIL